MQLENRTGDNSADAGPPMFVSVPNSLAGPLAVPATSAGENNQRVVESALENQSDCIRFLNPSATSSPSGWQTFKDGLKQGIFSPNDINVNLDNFPYYLSFSMVN
uniref:Uncharacterized protein n=1 Tax=Arundo donax TaxID=35708 RepID=A0A0A9DV88_ARUDO